MTMSSMSSASKKYRRTTLSIVLQALEGSKVLVELHDDTIIRGTLVSADPSLHLQLEDVVVKSLDGSLRKAQQLHVRGSKVRMVHLPGNVTPEAAVKEHRRKAARVKQEHAAAQGGVKALPKGAGMNSD